MQKDALKTISGHPNSYYIDSSIDVIYGIINKSRCYGQEDRHKHYWALLEHAVQRKIPSRSGVDRALQCSQIDMAMYLLANDYTITQDPVYSVQSILIGAGAEWNFSDNSIDTILHHWNGQSSEHGLDRTYAGRLHALFDQTNYLIHNPMTEKFFTANMFAYDMEEEAIICAEPLLPIPRAGQESMITYSCKHHFLRMAAMCGQAALTNHHLKDILSLGIPIRTDYRAIVYHLMDKQDGLNRVSYDTLDYIFTGKWCEWGGDEDEECITLNFLAARDVDTLIRYACDNNLFDKFLEENTIMAEALLEILDDPADPSVFQWRALVWSKFIEKCEAEGRGLDVVGFFTDAGEKYSDKICLSDVEKNRIKEAIDIYDDDALFLDEVCMDIYLDAAQQK